jgi:hypothetical protein
MSVVHAGPSVRSSEPFRKITLVRVMDSEMTTSASSPDQYELPFEISGPPGAEWVLAFRRAYEESVRAPRRVVRLAANRITVTVRVGEDQQRIADTLKDIVEKANIQCWTAWQREEEDEANRVEAKQITL